MRKSLITAAAFVILSFGAALAGQFLIEAGEENTLVFYSKAPMESFEGKTDRIEGSVNADLADLGSGVEVEVRVDMASLDTGISLRNRHMRENHLETGEFPEAVFRAQRVLKAPTEALVPGGSAEFVLAGSMTLHGVSREIEAPVKVSCGESGGRIHLDISSEFPIVLSDYDIKRPKFLVLKLNETQDVKIELRAWEVM